MENLNRPFKVVLINGQSEHIIDSAKTAAEANAKARQLMARARLVREIDEIGHNADDQAPTRRPIHVAVRQSGPVSPFAPMSELTRRIFADGIAALKGMIR